MRIESDEGFVLLVAKDDKEATLLAPIAEAINGDDKSFPALLVDNLEGGTEHRIINGVLQLTLS